MDPNGADGDTAPKAGVGFAVPKAGGWVLILLALPPVVATNLNWSAGFDVVLGPNEKLFCGPLGCNVDVDAAN